MINCDGNNQMILDNIYIVFTPNKLLDGKTNIKYIVYNFEQFTTDKMWISTYINFLKNAIFVMDYSIMNTIKLYDLGINTYVLPYMFDSNIVGDTTKIKKDIDVLFIGNVNNKRREWLKQILNEKYNCKIAISQTFNKNIELYARSKIVLNIHEYKGAPILEIPDVILALKNNCIVLSEESYDEYYNKMYEKITNIEHFKYDINEILNNYDVKKLVSAENNGVSKRIDIDTTDLINLIKQILDNNEESSQ
jgi:hypothetical protein